MRRHLPSIVAACVTALLISAFAIAGPGLGVSKTAPISGTGSSGDPLKLDVCDSGSAYISNGTSWACGAAGSTYTAGNGLTLTGSDLAVGCGASMACFSDLIDVNQDSIDAWELNLAPTSCALGEAVTAIDSNGEGTCSAVSGGAPTVQIVSSSGAMDLSLDSGDVDVVLFTHASAVTLRSIDYCDDEEVGRQLDLVSQSDSSVVLVRLTLAAFYHSDDGDFAAATTARPGHVIHLRCTGPTADETLANDGLYVWAVEDVDIPDGDKGDITVSTSGSVWNIDSGTVGTAELADDLDLSGNGYTAVGNFRGTQIDVASVTGALTDWNPTGLSTATTIRAATTGGTDLVSMAGGAADRKIQITNSGNSVIRVFHEYTTGTTAAMRFALNQNFVYIKPAESMLFSYDATSSKWRQASGQHQVDSFYVVGALTVDGNATVGGNPTLGNGPSDIAAVNAILRDTSTAPTLSSCGSSPTVAGGSWSFEITTGSGATACTATFAADKGTDSSCTVTARSGTQPVYSASDTALTMSTAAASATYDVICIGRP